MKIIITGATGFVGAHLVRHFSSIGHEVIALGRQEEPPKGLNFFAQWQKVDLTEKVKQLEADVFIHAAGLASDKGTREEFNRSNVYGTENMYQAFKGKHFIYISSASVYKSQETALKESSIEEVQNLSYYGRSKLDAEKRLKSIQREGSKITVLRPRAIYGTHDRVLLPRILNLENNNEIRVPGNMNIEISMTHIDNLIDSIKLALKEQSTLYDIYNVADGRHYSLRKIVETLIPTLNDRRMKIKELPLAPLKMITRLVELLQIPFPVSTSSLNYISQPCKLDLTKIKRELNYHPQRDFYTELPKIKEWVQKVGIDTVKASKADLPWTGL